MIGDKFGISDFEFGVKRYNRDPGFVPQESIQFLRVLIPHSRFPIQEY